MTGNNVSHANNKTKRKFNPNIQDKNIFSEALGRTVKIRVSTAGLRTLSHKGGLDKWLLNTPLKKLDPKMRRLRKQIEKSGKKPEAIIEAVSK